MSDVKTKMIFSRVNNELRNLENCLNYLMDPIKTLDQQFNKMVIN